MASKNRDQLAGAQAKVSARDLKQQQKFRAISKADDASTTGQLINPVGAVIANPTGAGGQAGAQGGFGLCRFRVDRATPLQPTPASN